MISHLRCFTLLDRGFDIFILEELGKATGVFKVYIYCLARDSLVLDCTATLWVKNDLFFGVVGRARATRGGHPFQLRTAAPPDSVLP